MGYRHKSPKALEDPLLQAIRLPLRDEWQRSSRRITLAYNPVNTALIYFGDALKWPFTSSAHESEKSGALLLQLHSGPRGLTPG